MKKTHGCARDLFSRDRSETETLKPETEAQTEALTIQAEARLETKAFRARDRDEAEAYQLRGETEPRHYCASRRPRDRDVKTEATSLQKRVPERHLIPYLLVPTFIKIIIKPLLWYKSGLYRR